MSDAERTTPMPESASPEGVQSVHTLEERRRLLAAVVEIRAEMFEMMARLDARVTRLERLRDLSAHDTLGGAR